MLLCRECSESKWATSREPDGLHLVCTGHRKNEESTSWETRFVPCGYTVVLPHYTAVVPTAR